MSEELAALERIESRLARLEFNSARALPWGMSLLLGASLYTLTVPYLKSANVPVLSEGVNKFLAWEVAQIKELGIYTQEKTTETPQLTGVHPHLMRVFNRASELAQKEGVKLHIRDSVRTIRQQQAIFKRGASKTLNSRHLTGHALDIEIKYAGKQTHKKDWQQCRKVNSFMQKAALELNIPIEWGGYWRSFPDGWHYQLPWKQYPKNKAIAAKTITLLTPENLSALIKLIKQREASNDHTQQSKKGGYVGWAQMGGATLVEIGLIKRANFEKLDDLAKAGKTPAHKQFLNNPDNWTIKGGKQTFLNSPKMQHKAMLKMIALHIKYGLKSGAITRTSSQKRIAGYAMAAQFGHTKATNYYLYKQDSPDGNGVLTSTYAKLGESIARN